MEKIILVPSSLGLNPLYEGHIPGTFRAPAVLMHHGLDKIFSSCNFVTVPCPEYSPECEPGTDILNGHKLRQLNLQLADEVEAAHHHNLKPVVIGGDCAILPGALLGSRRQLGQLALVHIDGHSDFRHPGNWKREPGARPGAAAGMDLALVTGRGEPLLTAWPGIEGSLIQDDAVIQLGERESLLEDYEWPDIVDTDIRRITIFDALKLPDHHLINVIFERLNLFPEMPYWIHLDMDVLDSSEMSAVDCPGNPGLSSETLVNVCRELFRNMRCCGITVTIYDPDLDHEGTAAKLILDMLRSITNDI
ncbi:arginase family protein [Erwinia billingiae]|uniref:arginase family protein n=1 Tax=Erwinia billingiae TaxID=182337 RepID=UPI001248FE2A|nr:arginase family protein [Erwinia billingiae]QEW31673.1 arginase family protein [Erwinia billingiae]